MTTLAILGHTAHGKTTLAEAIRGFGGPYQITDDGSCPHATEVAILVVSLPDGPMPGTRDAIQHLPPGPRLVVLLNQLDLLEDIEIADLVEMEVRDLITKYGRDGSAVPITRGSALRAGGGGGGGGRGHKADRTLHDLFAALG